MEFLNNLLFAILFVIATSILGTVSVQPFLHSKEIRLNVFGHVTKTPERKGMKMWWVRGKLRIKIG